MMNKSILTSLFAIALAGGVARAEDKADHQFCQQLSTFRSDVKTLDASGSSTTLAELRASSQKVIADAQGVVAAGTKMKSPASKELGTAAKQLKKDINALPEDITVDQARQKIDSDISDVRNAVQKLSAEAGCAGSSMGDKAMDKDKSMDKSSDKDKSMDKQDKMPQDKNSMDTDSDMKQ